MWVFRLVLALLANFLGNLLYALDVVINVLFGGDCRETVSSRLGRGKKAGKPNHTRLSIPVDGLFYLVRGERNHCVDNIITLPNGDYYALSSVMSRTLRKYRDTQKTGKV